jgi:hypothetical protein
VENFNKRIAGYLGPALKGDDTDWERWLPAMGFAYNSSYHSTIGTTPLQLLYGYPAGTVGLRPDVQTHVEKFKTPTDRLQTLEKQRQEAILHSQKQKDLQKRTFDKHANIHKFRPNQMVWVRVLNFLHHNRKFATKFEGPFQIVELFENYAVLKSAKGKIIKRNILHLKPFVPPFQPPTPPWELSSQQGEGWDAAQDVQPQETEDQQLAAAINLLLFGAKPSLREKRKINHQLINAIEINQRPYLLEVAIKILSNSNPDIDPLTSEERHLWNSFSQWERSVMLTGNPIGIPEWRPYLCKMPGRNEAAAPPPAVVAPPPAAVAAPPPPPGLPLPLGTGGTPGPSTGTRSRVPKQKKLPPPSDRVLRPRSASRQTRRYSPEPPTTRTRRKAPPAVPITQTPIPPRPSLLPANPNPRPMGNSNPPVPVQPDPAPSLWSTGWSALGRLLPGGPASGPSTDIANIDLIQGHPDSEALLRELDTWCFF